jgi:hypothetical protein
MRLAIRRTFPPPLRYGTTSAASGERAFRLIFVWLLLGDTPAERL